MLADLTRAESAPDAPPRENGTTLVLLYDTDTCEVHGCTRPAVADRDGALVCRRHSQ